MMKCFIILSAWALLVNFLKGLIFYIFFFFEIFSNLFFFIAQANTSTYISVVYNSDLTLYCSLSGNVSFYFTENNNTSKQQMIDYDSIKYISLNNSVLIIKKLCNFNDFLALKKIIFKILK
jgi:hypothetical protein